VTYFPASTAFEAVKTTKARLELSCHPLQGHNEFVEGALPERGDLAQILEEGSGSLEDREKWQLLSRELA
jgi:hypothetical protein